MKYEDLPKHFPEIYAEITPKVEGVFHPSEYESLFKSLNFKASVNAIPSNYGEASDLLRYEILHSFGGYYLDCDVKKSDIDFPSLLLKGSNPVFGFVCGYSWYPRNDIVGSLPDSLLSSNLKKNSVI